MSRILVVDDISNTLNFVREVLATAGYSVDGAGDGVEALERLKKEPFDLIVLDIWMPRMGGAGVLGALARVSRSS